ncbi:LysR substrate-binding domain-containing protein [Eleftheria terrae]|uniref:LysR substrate-binding domain-containing protein n=1 Tax=Eleftheria terrae TaxID=1597781 RepID=UPI00263B5BAA|nr:LysR substrate-binding domain-containing protein [Eleftheria terrae]WKB55035.1 LysR substrate-binding domain-containing protein [Eleftheria terrae]
MQRLPPLSSLRFFDAAARLGSFVAAASELHVTHGAVSRQVRSLEDALGVALFERRNRAVFLTPQGVQLQATTQAIFEQLARTVAELAAPPPQAPLVLSCEPTLAMRWLIPRLGNFYKRHPEIQLHLSAAGGKVDFQRAGVDLALRRNDFRWEPGLAAEVVGEEWTGPVCAPALLRRGRLELTAQRLLHTATRKSAWASWARAAGVAVSHRQGQSFEHFYLSLQAAGAGLGVAIGSAYMVQEDLAGSQLAAPFGFVQDGSSYCLLSPQPFEADARRAAVLAWLREQFAGSAREMGLSPGAP